MGMRLSQRQAGGGNPDGLSLDLAFAADKTLTARKGPTPTFVRASTATFIGSNGLIQSAANHEPRFDHDPSTGVCRGLLIEESRENALLNSAALATQNVTVTAAARTLSFYGTGTVVLSGAHVATVVGTGAFPSRRTLTFTPTAGTLTLTVTGTVQFAQLEVGAFPTSYIPTTTAALTRAQDLCTISDAAFASFYNQSEGTVFAEVQPIAGVGIWGIHGNIRSDGGSSIQNQSDFSAVQFFVWTAGFATQANLTISVTPRSRLKSALGIKANNFAASVNGGIAPDDTGTVVNTVNRLVLGSNGNQGGPQAGSAVFASFRYYRKRLPNAKLITLTTP